MLVCAAEGGRIGRNVHNPFSAYHPTVAFVYLAAMICLTMLAFHPVYVGIAVAGAIAASCVCKGVRRTMHSLWFVLVMWLIVALANFLFSQAGDTVLFELFGHAFRLEALCYGATMGAMLAAVIVWFMVYANVMDSEASAAVFGGALPTITLMISQVMRLVPQFIRRGAAVSATQNAATAAAPSTKRQRTAGYARMLSVLMGWGMEDGLVRSDAMRARGYGCGRLRTRYRRQRFAAGDCVLLAIILVLTAASAFLAYVACSQFTFYPYMDTLVLWWGYIPYILLAALPVVLYARERLLWR